MPPGAKNSWRVGRVRVEVSVGGIRTGCSLHHSDGEEQRLAAADFRAGQMIRVRPALIPLICDYWRRRSRGSIPFWDFRPFFLLLAIQAAEAAAVQSNYL